MARREARDQSNELRINDNLSDSEVVLYYRLPTTRERQEYQNMAVQRKGKRVEFNQAGARLKYGLAILTGVRDGDFERFVDGEYRPLSSLVSSADYVPDWKQWLETNASDLIMLLAAHVYDASATIAENDDDDIEGK